MLLPLPLGEVDLRSKDGEGEDAILSGKSYCSFSRSLFSSRSS